MSNKMDVWLYQMLCTAVGLILIRTVSSPFVIFSLACLLMGGYMTDISPSAYNLFKFQPVRERK